MATERVISSRVIGSSNPIAKKFRSIGNSIKGVGCGFILLVIGLVLIFQSVFGVKEYSKILAALPLLTTSEATGSQELVKVKGIPEVATPAVYAYEQCSDAKCFGTTTPQTTEASYYLSAQKQRFEIVKHVTTETITKDVGGDEVEETVEKTTYEEEWVAKETEALWASFKLDGKITVIGSDTTNLKVDLEEKTIPNVKIDNLTPLEYYGQQPSSQVGNTRLVYSYFAQSLPAPELIVTGELQSNTIKDGDPFIITTMNESDLIKTLGEEENFTRLAYALGSWLLTFIGLSMIMAPIIELVNWIPLFGWAAKAAAGAIAFIVATLLVAGSWLFLKFWWLILIILAALIVLAVFLVIRSRNQAAVKDK